MKIGFFKKKKTDVPNSYFKGYGITVTAGTKAEDDVPPTYTPTDDSGELISIPEPDPVTDQLPPEDRKARSPVVGWIVCVKGPNTGRAYELHEGSNIIGKKARDITIEGDETLSEEHMCIQYDPQGRIFTLAVGNACQMIYRNGNPLSLPERLRNYDTIETGASAFRFVGFCGEEFSWNTGNAD